MSLRHFHAQQTILLNIIGPNWREIVKSHGHEKNSPEQNIRDISETIVRGISQCVISVI